MLVKPHTRLSRGDCEVVSTLDIPQRVGRLDCSSPYGPAFALEFAQVRFRLQTPFSLSSPPVIQGDIHNNEPRPGGHMAAHPVAARWALMTSVILADGKPGALDALADLCSNTGGQGPEGAGLPGHPGQGPPGRQDGRRDVLLRAGGADAAFSLPKLNSHERCKAVDTDAVGSSHAAAPVPTVQPAPVCWWTQQPLMLWTAAQADEYSRKGINLTPDVWLVKVRTSFVCASLLVRRQLLHSVCLQCASWIVSAG